MTVAGLLTRCAMPMSPRGRSNEYTETGNSENVCVYKCPPRPLSITSRQRPKRVSASNQIPGVVPWSGVTGVTGEGTQSLGSLLAAGG